ncbi:hypothetical protein AeRB84_008804 [Aphanomyces euteiches]|nr:hypothetical protein AeRB84_008804 [Aphanomyces euteiches]
MEDEVKIVKTRRRYSLERKRNVLRALSEHTQKQVAELSGILLRTVQNFVREKNTIQASLLAKRRQHLGAPGRKEILPGGDDLLDYMIAMREKNFPLTTYHVVQQVKANHQEWVNEEFVYRHGFSRRRASTAKAMTTLQMLEVWGFGEGERATRPREQENERFQRGELKINATTTERSDHAL